MEHTAAEYETLALEKLSKSGEWHQHAALVYSNLAIASAALEAVGKGKIEPGVSAYESSDDT
jgi:hypothetical protein